MKIPEGVGSKYRFIILSGQRVAQLQKGAKPRLDGIRKMTTVAMNELEQNLLTFGKIGAKKDDEADDAESKTEQAAEAASKSSEEE